MMSGQLIGDLLSVGGKVQEERDRLAAELQESERLRTEAFHACEAMRLERDEWKAGAEHARQRVAQLQLQVAALEASLEQEQGRLKVLLQEKELQRKKAVELCETMRLERDGWKAGAEAGQQQATQLRQQLADADAQIRQFEQINDTRDELEHKNKELQAQLDAAEATPAAAEMRLVKLQMKDLTTARDAAFREIGELRKQRDELQAQIDAAAVTPAQQPDDNAVEQLERVRRLIGEICGWYVCADWLSDRERTTAWEQAGALLGHLQGEAG